LELNLLPCSATRELYRKVMGAQWLSWSQIQGMTKSKNEKELPFESIG
jgi:Fe-S cluster biosynthesis and repair protein YggX